MGVWGVIGIAVLAVLLCTAAAAKIASADQDNQPLRNEK